MGRKICRKKHDSATATRTRHTGFIGKDRATPTIFNSSHPRWLGGSHHDLDCPGRLPGRANARHMAWLRTIAASADVATAERGGARV
jgi:hypothetical protein